MNQCESITKVQATYRGKPITVNQTSNLEQLLILVHKLPLRSRITPA